MHHEWACHQVQWQCLTRFYMAPRTQTSVIARWWPPVYHRLWPVLCIFISTTADHQGGVKTTLSPALFLFLSVHCRVSWVCHCNSATPTHHSSSLSRCAYACADQLLKTISMHISISWQREWKSVVKLQKTFHCWSLQAQLRAHGIWWRRGKRLAGCAAYDVEINNYWTKSDRWHAVLVGGVCGLLIVRRRLGNNHFNSSVQILIPHWPF